MNNDCGCEQREDNYMFFQNLKTIQHAVSELLNMDPAQVDKLLSNGHAWAVDHITTSADDVEEVYHFITTSMGHEDATDSYNSQQPQFVPAGFKNHLRQVMGERIEKHGDVYQVKTSSGDRTLGTHPTKKAALKQLAAIEISKHRNRKNRKTRKK
jgi:hypothetical protein